MSNNQLTDVFIDQDDPRALTAIEKILEVRNIRVKFATEFHRNTSGERLNFRGFPYLREIYNSLAKTVVLQGSTQSMKSEFVIVDHLAMAYSGLSVFYVVPKFEFRQTYVQNRINRCVENVPEYKKIVGSGFFDSIALKSFGRGVIKYVGSNVFADMREHPADVLVVDEVDECDKENLAYAHDRLSASIYRFKRYLGNPRVKSHGINKYFEMSDQREWAVPCKSCGKHHVLDWFKTVVTEIVDGQGNIVDYRLRDTEWRPGVQRDIRLICPSCQGILDKTSDKGIWIPNNLESDIEGFHLSKLCNDLNSVASLWDEFKSSLNSPADLQRFYNSSLGIPFNAGSNRVTARVLERCAQDYDFVIEPDQAYIEGNESEDACAMGIDVGNTLDVQISKCLFGNKRQILFIGKVKPSLEAVCDLMHRYKVEFCVIDHGPEVGFVNDLKEVAPAETWSCVYRSAEGSDGRKTYNSGSRLITADRTECLDRGFSLLQQRKVLLPKNFAEILGGDYVDEMCGPVRTLEEDIKGRKKYSWSKCVDHQRHADVYCMLAAEALAGSVIDTVDVGIDIGLD